MSLIAPTISRGPFDATWESLVNYKVPAWYEDTKFGIFIHWGLYLLPAFGNEWYPRQMYQEGTAEFKHHVATYGPHAEFGLSSHRAEHWWFFDGGMKFDSDVRDPKYADFYGPAKAVADGFHHLHRKSLPMPDDEHLDDWLNRTCELVDKYEPQLVWFDWWIHHISFDRHLKQFAAYYYGSRPEL